MPDELHLPERDMTNSDLFNRRLAQLRPLSTLTVRLERFTNGGFSEVEALNCQHDKVESYDDLITRLYMSHISEPQRATFRWSLRYDPPTPSHGEPRVVGIGFIQIGLSEPLPRRGDEVTFAFTHFMAAALARTKEGRPNDRANEASDLAMSAVRVWDTDLHEKPWLPDDWTLNDGTIADRDATVPVVTPATLVPTAPRPAWAQDFISLDTETTGLGKDARVCSLGAVRFRNGFPIERWQCVVNVANVDWDSEEVRGALNVNGHTRQELEAGVWFAYAMHTIRSYLSDNTVWAGHNLGFDLRLLGQGTTVELPTPAMILDTKSLFVAIFGLSERHRLTHLCEYLSIPLVDSHTALGDAEASGRLLLALVDHAHAKGRPLPEHVDELREIQAEGEAIWRKAHPEYK